MSQHFLLSARARTLSLSQIARMSDQQAYDAFKEHRFAGSGGEPVCPGCESKRCYTFAKRRIFKCAECQKQFSLTSGTIFASRKMSIRNILFAIAVFVNGANGVSALRLSRDLGCSYKTAFILLHKLREVMGGLRWGEKLSGMVEIDGVWIGGHIKKKNVREERIDRRKFRHSGKRRSLVVMRERRRGGRTVTTVVPQESDALATILANVQRTATVVTDEGAHWNVLDAFFKHQTINHNSAYSLHGVHTNNVESFNSRVRRGERGVYHRISGAYLPLYADEFSWREDRRRVANGSQWAAVVRAAARRPVSRDLSGYWQRRRPEGAPPQPSQPPRRLV